MEESPPGGRAGAIVTAPGLAPVKSGALGDGETRVADQRGVPGRAQAPEVGGAPPGLVELRVQAGPAEPGLGAERQPRAVRRPVAHETQDMPLPVPEPAETVLVD